MEIGESSRAARRRAFAEMGVILRFRDNASETTWDAVTARPRKGKPKKKGTKSQIYGYQNCKFQSVLRQGWLAERRVMEHDRVYMYYYDPSGKQYTRWKKAKAAMDQEAARAAAAEEEEEAEEE